MGGGQRGRRREGSSRRSTEGGNWREGRGDLFTMNRKEDEGGGREREKERGHS